VLIRIGGGGYPGIIPYRQKIRGSNFLPENVKLLPGDNLQPQEAACRVSSQATGLVLKEVRTMFVGKLNRGY
jgi:hypothetical protein